MRVAVLDLGDFLGWHLRTYVRAFPDLDLDVRPVAADGTSADAGPDADVTTDVRADVLVVLTGPDAGDGPDVVRDLPRRLGADRVLVVVEASRGYASGVPWRAAWDGTVPDVRVLDLPVLFGEDQPVGAHRPVAEVVDAVQRGVGPTATGVVDVLHAQAAAAAVAAVLTDGAAPVGPSGEPLDLDRLPQVLRDVEDRYRTGEVPVLRTALDLDLLNTWRAATLAARGPFALVRHADARGDLVEVVRAHGSPSQVFVSTTVPGARRGGHYHRRKIERFVVLSGRGLIRMRRMFGTATVELEVTGDRPVAVDMPTLWTHELVNHGDETLLAAFWVNEILDPAATDTTPEAV